jgi:hypothetical protein
VAVDGVVTGVQAAAGEPPVEGRAGIVEQAGRRLVPVDRARGFCPELLGLLE